MSDDLEKAKDKLAQSRQAIVDYIQRKDRGPKELHGAQIQAAAVEDGTQTLDSGMPLRDQPRGWLGGARRALRTWWRHHPAHMAVEVAAPVLERLGRNRPFLVLGVAAAIGAGLVLVRPWKVVSLTSLLVGLVKSSKLSSFVLSAVSAAADWQPGKRR